MLKRFNDFRRRIGTKVIRFGGEHWQLSVDIFDYVNNGEIRKYYLIEAVGHRTIATVAKMIYKIITVGLKKPVYMVNLK